MEGGSDELISRDDAVELQVESVVRMAISKFKKRKAPGWDGVKAEAFKCVGRRLADTMGKLMIKMRRGGVFPELWKKRVLRLIKKAVQTPNE